MVGVDLQGYSLALADDVLFHAPAKLLPTIDLGPAECSTVGG